MGEQQLLDRILAPGSLSVRFQPVVELSRREPRPHYFEALIRGPEGTSAENPSILFEYARKKSRESAVDRACVEAILGAVPDLHAEAMLGVNVHASTLAMDADFVDFLEDALQARGFPSQRLVVEIVEHAPPWDVSAFLQALERLRALGARIALDDVGLGHSNFMMILQCRPDYFKVDRYFVSGCAGDFHRRAVLASVVQLARPFGARVVAEGVEDPADLHCLRRLGIRLVQGYLFGVPMPARQVTEEGGRIPPVYLGRRAAPADPQPGKSGRA